MTARNANSPALTDATPLTPEEEAGLRESLRRCSPATCEAAIAYRKTGDISQVPVIVLGVIERYVERELRPKLQQAGPETRLIEDLAIDSLTMMETVMLLEEVLRVTINNEELRHLRTLGDVQEFLDCKLRGMPLPEPKETSGERATQTEPRHAIAE